uniref:IgGFc-binding protein-like n=1 Tax=Geotrypetes seraphini TaxID=260995 RepID=A0A6P8SQN2_GEOSA|nr:IgGFc-binding protein-like [Geotrypetes seraphini]
MASPGKRKAFQPNEKIVSNECKEVCSCSPTGVECSDYSCASDEKCVIRDGIMGCINKDPCKSAKCRTKETCKIQDGNPVCVPDYIGTCWGWGDPHYHTFDGFNYDFQGTCTYTIAKYVGTDPTLVPFVIDEKNDNRGNQAVSYVRLVNIYVWDLKISIYKGEFGKIRINDEITSLPVTLRDGNIQVSQGGLTAVVKTSFGLEVSYEWNWHLVIKIPSSYYGTTAGLCGNFNEKPGDDMITLDGKAVTSIVEWASSWKVKDRDPFCFHICKGICPTCDESKQKLYAGEQHCGLISKLDGPFRECHNKISPDDFVDSCVYDVCINGGANQFLCQALNVYATTCRKQGVKIYDWRTPSGCPLPCPENSHYESCGNACPASCSDRSAPSQCTDSCVETCQCNTGFVLSVDKCVSIDSCGCNYNGFYYKPNEEFWSDDNCKVRCKCDPSLGMVVCKNTNCKSSERCMVMNGIRDCYPLSYSTCIAHGDTHYITFDGLTYDFMGTCIYQLVGVTSKDPTLTQFIVNVQNNNRGNKVVPFTKVVTFQIYGVTMIMSQDYPHKLQVNGVLVSLPFYYQNKKIMAYLSGTHVIINTENEISVSFDSFRDVTVKIPSTYTNAVSGLCGNNNKNSNDDMIMTNGIKASTASQFGDRWKVGDVPGCVPECKENCPVYTDSQKETYKTDKFCGLLIKKNGPFSNCFDSIDPTLFFNNCLFDAVRYKGHYSAYCSAISTYVSECQTNGIEIQEWRTDSFCSPSCPSNTHYEFCGNGCPATCYSLSSPEGCDAPCREGCYCNNGFILSGDKCVPIANCGCVYKDRYYTKGDVFYPSGQCNEQCQCQENGVVKCTEASCGANEECKVVNGVLGCQPVGCGKCIVSGDLHYISFDGTAFDFQGTCSYILASVNTKDLRLQKFSVVVENESYGSANVAVTKTVAVSVYDSLFTLKQGVKWKVEVNGEILNVPTTILDGKVWINQEGNNIVLQTDFGMKILYDTVHYVLLSVPSNYKGTLGGLCGNFNDNTKDDYMLLGGQIAKNVDEFGSAWKVQGMSKACTDGCGDKCPTCDNSKLNTYKVGSSCGMITNPGGPFKDCHIKVNPAKYYDSCIYDLCAMEGKGDILCRSLQAYAAACQAVGASIKMWRTPSFCPLTCPANSHYELCTRTCDYTCAGIAALSTCTDKCFEGCECNAGYMFDGESCVSMEKCGCVYEGRYLKIGETTVSLDCSQRYTCSANGLMSELVICEAGDVCMLKGGVRGCFKKEGQCTLAMGAKFTSFDGLSGQVASNRAYEVASLCDLKSASWFRVLVDIQSCGSSQSAAAKAYVFFQNVFIAVSKNTDTSVNGQKVQLPVKVSDSVSVIAVEKGVMIRQSDKVQILFNTNGEVTVNVNQNLAGVLCGACGNFNGNSSDDLTLSNGKTGQSISEVVNSWNALDLTSCDVPSF